MLIPRLLRGMQSICQEITRASFQNELLMFSATLFFSVQILLLEQFIQFLNSESKEI